jgi:hypothetical protein
LDLQVADALGALAKLTRKQFQQAPHAGDSVGRQITSAFVGGAQLAFGYFEPREPKPRLPFCYRKETPSWRTTCSDARRRTEALP